MSAAPYHSPHWTPPTDVVVKPGVEVVILVDLPGLQRQDVELSVDQQRLHIVGERPDDDPDARAVQYLLVERPHGRFACMVDVPTDYDLAHAKAAYCNGILRIVVPARNGI